MDDGYRHRSAKASQWLNPSYRHFREDPMYKHIFASLLVATVTMAAVPGHAQWKSYVNKQLGFSFMAPGEVKASVGNSRGQIAGPRQTILYRSVADNIEYKVTVMSFV